MNARGKCLIFVLSLAALFPLMAQNISDAENESIDFSSDEYPVMEGEGITITGSADTTQQMERVDRETIEKAHASDIPSLLEETLDLGVTRYGPYGSQAGVNLRGFDSRRVAFLVDGIPVNSAAAGNFDFYSIDPFSIERIEVIHGGADTKYNVSGALGGVINFITIKKQKAGWSFGGNLTNVSYLPGKHTKTGGTVGNPQWQDIVDTQRVNVFGAYGADKYSFRLNVFGDRAGNHFPYQDYFGYARRKEGNEILDGGASVSFVGELPQSIKLITTGAFYYGDKNIPTGGYSSVYRKLTDKSSRINIMLDMPRAFHNDLSMELSLAHNWGNSNFGEGADASLHDEHRLFLINRWAWYPAEQLTLRFGGDYTFIHLDSTNSGLHNGHRGGLYLTTEYTPSKKFLLIASIKGTTNGKNIAPIPKLGLAWTINDKLTLKNNYFRSFKFPDYDDLYFVQAGYAGNPNLKNEDGWGADLGIELLSKILEFTSAIYGEWTKDSIHWSNISGTWRPENYGTAAFFGWDNRLKLTLPFSPGPLGKPIIKFSWLFQLSWLLTGTASFADKLRIPYMPLHTIGVSLELPWESKNKKLPGSLVASGHFESARYTNTANTARLDPHFLLNIIFNQKLNTNFNIFARLNNVLNTRYVSFEDYPMPGISLTIGMNMVFEGIGIKNAP